MDIGFSTPLEPISLSQSVPPQFWMDLYCPYYKSQGNDTNQCTTLRHGIQDIIDQASISADQLGAFEDPLVAHFTNMVPSTFDPHPASHVEDVDTRMMSN